MLQKKYYHYDFVLKVLLHFFNYKNIIKTVFQFKINKKTLYYWCEWWLYNQIFFKKIKSMKKRLDLKKNIFWKKLKIQTPFINIIYIKLFTKLKKSLHKNVCYYYLKKNYSYRLFIKNFLKKDYNVITKKKFNKLFFKIWICKHLLLNFFFLFERRVVMVCLRLHFFWNMVIANAFIKKGTILIDNTIIFNNNYLIKNNAMLKIYLPSYYWKYYMKPYAILRLHFKEYYQVIFNVEYSLTAIGGVFFNFQLFEYDIKINFKNKFLYWNHFKII